MATELSGSLLSLGFVRVSPFSGSLLSFGFENSEKISGSLLSMGFAKQEVFSGSLLTVGLSNEVIAKNATLEFLHSRHQSPFVGDFSLRMTVNDKVIDLCRLAKELSITHGENESFVCYLTLQESVNRPTQPIDLYEWYGKPIYIDCVTKSGEMRLYRGIVDSAELDFVSGKTKITCSDRRKRLLDKLSENEVKSIGYTSEAVHGKFDNLSDELEKRLTTIPASYEFDVYGNGYLNWWKPSSPSHTISDCEVFYTQPQVRLAQVGQVVNRVDIELGYTYSRLRQRRIMYNYDSGLTACSNGYIQYPTLDGLIDAISQTGWVMGGGSLERAQRSGWVNCGTDGMRGINRDAGDKSVMRGQFEALNRWTQNVRETYTISLINQASITRYEELSDRVSAQVSAEVDNEEWETLETPKYEATERNYFEAFFIAAPKFKGADFYQATNGDWIGNLDHAQADFENAFKTLYHMAYTKMLASHRQNTFEADIKFMPDISLKQSHQINHQHFKGLVKVAGYTHTFDLETRHVQTHVRYKFFQNAEAADNLTLPTLPNRIVPSFQTYSNYYPIRRVDLPKTADVEMAKGLVYQADYINFKTQIYKLIGWRIPTPEIEQQSTDADELASTQSYEVGLYSDDVHILI